MRSRRRSYSFNCASSEYFGPSPDLRALDLQGDHARVPRRKGRTAKTVGFFAKRHAGDGALYGRARITDPKDLQGFELGGYALR